MRLPRRPWFAGHPLLHALGGLDVLALRRRQVAQQFAHRGIGGSLRRQLVEAPRFHLHHRRPLAHRVDAQLSDQPHRPVLHKALHVGPANQGNVLAKALAVEFDQRPPVVDLLVLHLAEHLGRAGIVGLEPRGNIGVNAAVLLLRGNSQGEDLLLGEVPKVAGHAGSP